MPECPRCYQRVDSQAVACPYCKFDLKAFGHPGIPLHRASQDSYLCTTCLYHQDDTCNFPSVLWLKTVPSIKIWMNPLYLLRLFPVHLGTPIYFTGVGNILLD
jgi:hypothetical protein